MSHVAEIRLKDEITGLEVVMNDLDVWELAAKSLGGELVRGQKTYQCYESGWVGDTKPPPGWSPALWGKCEHAIKFPDCRWEVGLLTLNGKMRAYFDYFGSDQLVQKLGGKAAPHLTAAYSQSKKQVEAQRALVAAAKIRGYGVKQVVTEQQVIRMRISVP